MTAPDASGAPQGETAPVELGTAPGPAGWYADPYGRFLRRFWDGSRWTAYAGGTQIQWDPPPEPTPVPDVGRSNLAWVGFAVASFGVGAGLSFVVDGKLGSGGAGAPDALGLVLPSVALWLPMLGVCLLAFRRAGGRLRGGTIRRQFRLSDVGLGLAGSIVGRMLVGTAASPIPLPTRQLRDLGESAFQPEAHGLMAWTALVLVVCVGAPLVEEIVFRGLIQPQLVGRFGPVGGVSIASLLFGAAHLLAWDGSATLAYAGPIAAAGLVLGLLRHQTGRLGPAIMAHALFNAQAMVALALL